MMRLVPWYIRKLEQKKVLTVVEVDQLLLPLKLLPDQAMAVKNWLLERGRMEVGVVKVISPEDLENMKKG
jgi:hypothetical protein